MVTCERLYEAFKANDLVYFTGVPDSTFKQWMSFLADNEERIINRIAANEGNAIAHASGYYLATGKVGVVYMQNSGLGNCVNPLTSLADPEVFGIPMILMIGWRGEPEQKDEPQHKKMGRVMLPLLEALEIPSLILDENKFEEQIKSIKKEAEAKSMPVALIVKRGLLKDYSEARKKGSIFPLTREEAIKTVIDTFTGNEVVISTTGKTSRELFEYREAIHQGHETDFYTVGSMGHSTSIALEIALQKPEKRVYVFDGDGALIMHAGSLATIGRYASPNLIHIVFDNNSYESTGGQPTVSDTTDIASIALGSGYKEATICSTKDEIVKTLKGISKKLAMIVIKVRKGSREDLSRPTLSPVENKVTFMKKLLTSTKKSTNCN